MRKAIRAAYKEGKLIFADEQITPEDGTEVIVIFPFPGDSKEPKKSAYQEIDAIEALRGRGKGENLVQKLLKSRREDLEHDEKNYRRLRS